MESFTTACNNIFEAVLEGVQPRYLGANGGVVGRGIYCLLGNGGRQKKYQEIGRLLINVPERRGDDRAVLMFIDRGCTYNAVRSTNSRPELFTTPLYIVASADTGSCNIWRFSFG